MLRVGIGSRLVGVVEVVVQLWARGGGERTRLPGGERWLVVVLGAALHSAMFMVQVSAREMVHLCQAMDSLNRGLPPKIVRTHRQHRDNPG